MSLQDDITWLHETAVNMAGMLIWLSESGNLKSPITPHPMGLGVIQALQDARAFLKEEKKPDSGCGDASGKLLTFPEAGRRLGLSRATIWRMVGRGEFSVVKIGKGWGRIPESELDRVMGRNKSI